MANQRTSPEVGVSAREAEILAALGEHLTNAEIAARLFISVRTVESHVSSLLRKLQANDRRALAAMAANLHSGPTGGPTAVAALPSPLTARRIGDPLIESAALDQLTVIQLARGEVRAAAASALRRTELMAPLQVTALTGLEFFDGFTMAADCAVAAGDLRAARRHAERLRDLPFHREEGHLATVRLLVVTALAGDWNETVVLAERFREGWERAGRPRAGNLSRGAHAAATVAGLRGTTTPARCGWTSPTL